MRCIYGIFGREITEYTVIYGVCIRFWPTLIINFIFRFFSDPSHTKKWMVQFTAVTLWGPKHCVPHTVCREI